MLARGQIHAARAITSGRHSRGRASYLQSANALSCRVTDLDWRLGRVYFLAFLNPSQGQPDPALIARLASPRNLR